MSCCGLKYGDLISNIWWIGLIFAIVSVGILCFDARYNFSPIPRQYYVIPKDGDSYPVHGSDFWFLALFVFALTVLDTTFGLLYVVWRWKRAYKGDPTQLMLSNVTVTVTGLEIFLALTRTFLVIISLGHVVFLAVSVVGRTIVMILTIRAKPFDETPTPNSEMYSKQYKKLGYSSL